VAQQIEILLEGEWVPVLGALIHVGGHRFRAIVTSGVDLFVVAAIESPTVRVNGRPARDISLSFPARESAERGYVSFELTLDPNDP
jgi:hypothetical protein